MTSRHLVLACLLLLSACAPLAVTGPDRGAAAPLHTRLEFVDTRLQPIPLEILDAPPRSRRLYQAARFPDPLRLQIGHVAGHLAGPAAAVDRTLLLKRSQHVALERQTQGGFTLDLADLERALAAAATGLAPRPEAPGFSIHPAATRLARLQLASLDNLWQPVPAVTGFLDRGSGDELALVYVDRPSRISGRIDLGRTGTFVDAFAETRTRFTGLYDHDLDLPRAGLHWVRIQHAGEGRFRISRSEPAGPVIVFVLEAAVPRNLVVYPPAVEHQKP